MTSVKFCFYSSNEVLLRQNKWNVCAKLCQTNQSFQKREHWSKNNNIKTAPKHSQRQIFNNHNCISIHLLKNRGKR